jgi:hypothetical protein
MQRATNGRQSVSDDSKTVCGKESRAAKIASGGIRTTRDVKDLGLAIAEDILSGELSHKVAGPVCRSVTLTIRTAEFEAANGGGTIDLGDSRREHDRQVDALAQREAELMEELNHLRKERAAAN